MKIIVGIITMLPLMLVTGLSQFILNPYLIGKGLIPREALVVTMYGITALLLGMFAGVMMEKYDKKYGNSKGTEVM
jgi:hypothetical protein